jgi:hypothetical protein
MATVVNWRAFEGQRPDLAAAGQRLIYQFGVGLAFLATTAEDGGPRVHPMCPVLHDHGLYALLVPSPKRDDLHRDGRFALHSFPCDDNEDAFYVAGVATPEADGAITAGVRTRYLAERGTTEPPPGFDDQELFALDLERCLYTVTSGHGDPAPRHTVWRAGEP